jgi:redox-sensitive bicupin YhaK (pirin superfamily)
MKQRTIYRHIEAQDIQMGPVKLKQPLPAPGLRQVDPFLLLHHGGPKQHVPNDPNMLHVGAHPHRGFEPVTFIFQGEIRHKDSMGNDSVIKAGGVQWMTAGSGVVHSESASEAFRERGGELEIIQLWVNLPADMKMVEPRYQGFQREEIPLFETEDKKVKVQVVSGDFQGLTGPVDSLTGIRALAIRTEARGHIQIEESEDNNLLLYMLHGSAEVNGESLSTHTMLTFHPDGEIINIQADSESLLLYVAGKPIEERLAMYGPFVMNSHDEIVEAVQDFQKGKMGTLSDS